MKQKWKMKVALGCTHVSQAWGEMYHRWSRLFPHVFICTICLVVVLNTKDYPLGKQKYNMFWCILDWWDVTRKQIRQIVGCFLMLNLSCFMEDLLIMNEVYIFIVIFFFLNYENNIAESNCDTCWSADGGDINLHAEWPCNFHDNILSLTLQLIKYTKLGAFSSQNREYALHVNITCSILSTKIILFTVEHVFLHYKP